MLPERSNASEDCRDHEAEAQGQEESQHTAGDRRLLRTGLLLAHVDHAHCHQDQAEELVGIDR